jgi:hypothetical protein
MNRNIEGALMGTAILFAAAFGLLVGSMLSELPVVRNCERPPYYYSAPKTP